MSIFMAFPIIFPIVMALILLLGRMEDTGRIHRFAMMCVIINAAAAWAVILFAGDAVCTLVSFTDKLELAFRLDGLSRIFAGMVSVLWIFTTVYAFEYMKHEGMENKFFAFWLVLHLE